MLEDEIVQGRKIGSLEIGEIEGLIEANPLWSRRRLSVALAQRWQWYATSGQLKDMAARSLLLKLHERGLIVLPERRRAPTTRRSEATPDLLDSLPHQPVEASLSSLRPLRIQVVGPKQPNYHEFQRYLAQHHYLSYRGPIGENIGYLIRSCTGVDLACLLFGLFRDFRGIFHWRIPGRSGSCGAPGIEPPRLDALGTAFCLTNQGISAGN